MSSHVVFLIVYLEDIYSIFIGNWSTTRTLWYVSRDYKVSPECTRLCTTVEPIHAEKLERGAFLIMWKGPRERCCWAALKSIVWSIFQYIFFLMSSCLDLMEIEEEKSGFFFAQPVFLLLEHICSKISDSTVIRLVCDVTDFSCLHTPLKSDVKRPLCNAFYMQIFSPFPS